MQTQNKVKPKIYNLKGDIKTFIPKKVMSQIQYLCTRIHDVEWSGILFYDTQGDIDNPSNFKIIIKHIFLMHKGSAGYTEYDYDEEVVGFRMDNPESLKWKIAHIHSHNNMKSYFSGTDMDELVENSEFHNYYLSIVVNNRNEIVGKVGFRGAGVDNAIYECNTGNGNPYKLSAATNKTIQFVYDCDIEIEDAINVGEDFEKRTTAIITKSNNKNAERQLANTMKSIPQNSINHALNRNTPNPFDDYYNPRSNNLVNEIGDDLVEVDEDSFHSYWLMQGDITSNDYLLDEAIEVVEASFATSDERITYATELIGMSPELFTSFFMGIENDINEVFLNLYNELLPMKTDYKIVPLLLTGLNEFINTLKKIENGSYR